ncbi:MAG: hypothetical protein ACI361_02425 [Atopobiaceae bacterium]
MDAALAAIRAGHAQMAGCCACYLAWWAIFFWPKVTGHEAEGPIRYIGIAAIIGAVILGALGATRIAQGAGMLAPAHAGLIALGGGIALYAVLLFVTEHLFHRVPTTELVLFCACLALELFCAAGLAAAGHGNAALLLFILAFIGFILSLVCYVRYYELAPLASFICGCLPLGGIGLISLIFALAL